MYQIESHIKKYGQLPGMPSAKEVEKNGADLEEINRLLVEKVEELTLHLIMGADNQSSIVHSYCHQIHCQRTCQHHAFQKTSSE